MLWCTNKKFQFAIFIVPCEKFAFMFTVLHRESTNKEKEEVHFDVSEDFIGYTHPFLFYAVNGIFLMIKKVEFLLVITINECTEKIWSHFDLKSWVTGGTKIRPGIQSNWRIFESKWLDIGSQFELTCWNIESK